MSSASEAPDVEELVGGARLAAVDAPRNRSLWRPPEGEEEPLEPVAWSLDEPPEFEAEVGDRGGSLVYRARESGRRYAVSWSVDPRAVTGEALVAYEFAAEDPPVRLHPVLRIVAAPGVTIRQDLPSSPVVEFEVLVIRVQSASRVPPQGASLHSSRILMPSASFGLEPVVALELPNGIDFVHAESGQTIEVRVQEGDGRAKFVYEVHQGSPRLSGVPTEEDGSVVRGNAADPSIVRIAKTPSVDVRWAMQRGLERAWVDPRLEVFEVEDLDSLPDADQTPAFAGRPLDRIEVRWTGESLALTAMTVATDVALGLIPVVGSLVELAELTYGVQTGRDRWGRPLTRLDLALLALGLLPLLGGVLRGAKRMADGALVDPVLGALSRAEQARVQDWSARIRRGEPLPANEIEEATELLKRVDGLFDPGLARKLTVTELFDAEGRFRHVELETLYQDYLKNPERGAVGRDAWIRRTRKPAAMSLLEDLLGPGFRKAAQVGSEPLLLSNVPRPVGMSDERLAELLQRLDGDSSGKLLERLTHVLRLVDEAGQVSRGHFNILKGNIAEILSARHQQKVLERFRNDPTYKDATVELWNDVRAQRAGKNESVLYTDNMIVARVGDDVQVLAIFEVKAGKTGGYEGTSQFFRWRERDLDSEFTVFANGRSYRYNPSDGEGGRIVGLGYGRHEAHVVAPRDARPTRDVDGLANPESAEGVKPRIVHQLDETSREIEYLARVVFESQ